MDTKEKCLALEGDKMVSVRIRELLISWRVKNGKMERGPISSKH